MTVSHGRIHIDWGLPENFRIQTDRLDLVPGEPQPADTDWQERGRLSELLTAHVPNQWPPDLVVDRSSPDGAGWWNWYIVRRELDQPVLIGMAGIKGWPAVSGSVQTGCAFLPQFQGQGCGTEAIKGLTSWLLARPQVERVIAETPVDNDGANSVLRKVGFVLSNSNTEEGLLRFEKTRT